MKLRICLAGATGWAGAPLARAILQSDDLLLVAGTSRKHAGKQLSAMLENCASAIELAGTAAEALQVPCDVFVEYTNVDVAKSNVLTAIDHGVPVVIGTSGLSDEDFAEIDTAARTRNVGVLAGGNFSLPAVLLQKCAELAARYMPQWEVIDYASSNKVDAPSGTVRELIHRLSTIGQPKIDVPIEQVEGSKESRGASMNSMQVHSIRLPGFTISAEAIFGSDDQRLSIRYDAGSDPQSYVKGALLAIRKVPHFVGLKRGLISIMEL